jgi:TolB-like protein/DNA-binding winged helix-turn-helix (wHTH) protein/Flp pilus assembly protein TadD
VSLTLSTNGNLYRFDDVTVDGENFRVQKNGRSITLTPRAFDVLIFLIRNSKRVVEKQEIFDSVWKDIFVSDNALTKIIKEIRQAINDDANQPRYIETVPKRGYRFIADIKNGTETKELDETRNIEKSPETILPPSAKRKNFLIIGVVVLGLLILSLGFLVFSEWRSEIAAENAPIDSIAVLPFENAGQDPNLEYLSDGITENIINSLARLPNLRILPRSTVFYYKNKPEDPHTIGRMLRVSSVLTGKVVQRGDTLIIQTELIDINRKAQIWGQQYNRPFTDVFNVQENIAREIALNLRLHITGAEQEQLARRNTENTEAYRLYLQGRFYWNKRTPKDLQKSTEYFGQAIALDQNYALAYAGLADAFAQIANYGGAPPREAMPKAKEAILKALSLDNNLAEAHAALGFILMCYDFDFAGSEREYGRAVELNPNYATAHLFYGELLMYLGRFEESFVEYGRALEIDPLSLITRRMYGESLLYAGKYDEAVAQYKQALDLDANFASAHYSLSVVYQLQGNYAGAIEEFAKSQEIIGERQNAALARESFAKGGWQEYLRAMTGKSQQVNLPLYTLATLHAALGEKNKAFAELEKAYENREHFLIWIKVDPRLEHLHDDPRFQDLLRRIGF